MKRFDKRKQGFFKAQRGDFGVTAQKEFPRFSKMPLEAAGMFVSTHLTKVVDGKIANCKVPLPDNPQILSRNIKRLAYFLRAAMVGFCHIPDYAVYSRDIEGKIKNIKICVNINE